MEHETIAETLVRAAKIGTFIALVRNGSGGVYSIRTSATIVRMLLANI